MLKKISRILTTVLLSVTVVALVGCNGGSAGSENANYTINIYGSTSVQPIAELIGEVYEDQNEGIEVLVQGVGSTQGIRATADGETQIGTSSRKLTADEEKTLGLTQQIIAYDCIAVIVNPNNTVTDLSKDQIKKIYSGEITNWKDVGGADQKITIVNREEGSGTRGAFEELLGLETLSKDSISFDSTGAVKSTVAGDEAAIGYISLGVLDETVIAVTIDGIEPNSQNVKNDTYALWRPFIFLTKGILDPEVQAFINFTLDKEAQDMIAKENYIRFK